MKQTIRFRTFETNSSSTHSCVICTEDEYNKWQQGELLYDGWKDVFLTKDEVDLQWQALDDGVKAYYEGIDGCEGIDEWRSENDKETLDEFCDADCLEVDITTKKVGDEKIYVVCRYGYR